MLSKVSSGHVVTEHTYMPASQKENILVQRKCSHSSLEQDYDASTTRSSVRYKTF